MPRAQNLIRQSLSSFRTFWLQGKPNNLVVVPTFCNVLGTVREYCPFSQNTAEDKHELAYSLGNGSLFLL